MSRDDQQVRTIRVTVRQVMRTAQFERGLNDVRKGAPFDWRIGLHEGSWNYEPGRLFGFIAPLDMPLRIGSKLNPKAVALCKAALNRKLIP